LGKEVIPQANSTRLAKHHLGARDIIGPGGGTDVRLSGRKEKRPAGKKAEQSRKRSRKKKVPLAGVTGS